MLRKWQENGYGSIPISTIFSGMNIHKSQLFDVNYRGIQGFDPQMSEFNFRPVGLVLLGPGNPWLAPSFFHINLGKGNHPQMAELFRLVNYYNLARSIHHLGVQKNHFPRYFPD